MGIYDFYFNWLKKQPNFAGIFQQNFNNVSSFSIDFNSVIHNIAQLVYGYGNYFDDKYGKTQGPTKKLERQNYIKNLSDDQLLLEFHAAIGNKILQLVQIVGVKSYIFIAVDGPAPQAKVSQKRSRRFQAKKKPMVETIVESMNVVEPVSRFDSNCISPGTDFMIKLDGYLTQLIEKNINNLATTVYYSSHLVSGEGEHKIIDYFRQDKIKGDGMHVIYGMDSDWVMLTSAVNKPNLYLWREDSGDILSIDRLKFQLSQKMGGSVTASDDFVLLFYLFGNDFLPRHPTLTSDNIENMINIYNVLYKEYGLTYVVRNIDKVTINWNNFIYFIYNMAQNEATFLELQLSKEYIKKDSLIYATTETNESGETIKSEKFNLSRFKDFWYYHELSPQGDIEKVQRILTSEKMEISQDRIESMVKSYLNGINWVFHYYFNGFKYINLKWYYPYYHAPLFYDIYNYLNEKGVTEITEYNPPAINSFLNVYQELLATLPPSSIDLIPMKLKWFMVDIRSPIIDYYPIDFLVDYELKDKEYKGIPILPFVDPEKIILAMRTYITFESSEVSHIMYPKDIKYVRDPAMDQLICENKEFKRSLNTSSSYRGRGRGRGRGDRGGRGRGGGRGESISTSNTNPSSQQQTLQLPGVQPETRPGPSTLEFTPVFTLSGGPYGTENTVNFELDKI
jgi:5'-3' exoribonuclease 1